MSDKLKKMYFSIYGILVVVCVIIAVLWYLNVVNITPNGNQMILKAMVIISALLSFVVPMSIKFYHLKNNMGKPLKEDILFDYMKKMIFASAAACVVIPVAFGLGVFGTPLIFILMMGLASAFYNFPSKRKWEYEKKLLATKR